MYKIKIMKKLQLLFYAIIFLTGTVVFSSCSQSKKGKLAESGEPEHSEMTEDMNHEEEKQEHESSESHSDHGEVTNDAGGSKTWTPSGNGADLIRSDFHFITGGIENIKPDVKQGNDGSSLLELTANGTPAAFVFHNKYGNVGLVALIKRLDFKGTLKVIHHAKNLSNYEFVAIKGNHMKLGRIVNGEDNIYDESEFSTDAAWISLKVSAAGSHYKGYIGDKTIAHGHGDKMEDGFVGLMVEGTGKIQVKSIEIARLEDE